MARMSKAEKAKYAAEQAAKQQQRQSEILRAIESGCPECGAKVKRNLSMTGWWQCSQLGAEGFRADPAKPSCSWQMFE